MLKDLAWNSFKKTGDINIFMEYLKIKNLEQNIDIQFSKKNDSMGEK